MKRLRARQRARHFLQRDLFVQLWLVPVWLGLGVASLVIAVLPFRRIAPLLGHFNGTSKPELAVSAVDEARAQQIGRTAQLAAHYAPWRADCYPQAIIARLLLGLYRLPFTMAMGLRKDAKSGKTLAHAWIECGNVIVTGGDDSEEYNIVAVFSSRKSSC